MIKTNEHFCFLFLLDLLDLYGLREKFQKKWKKFEVVFKICLMPGEYATILVIRNTSSECYGKCHLR